LRAVVAVAAPSLIRGGAQAVSPPAEAAAEAFEAASTAAGCGGGGGLGMMGLEEFGDANGAEDGGSRVGLLVWCVDVRALAGTLALTEEMVSLPARAADGSSPARGPAPPPPPPAASLRVEATGLGLRHISCAPQVCQRGPLSPVQTPYKPHKIAT